MKPLFCLFIATLGIFCFPLIIEASDSTSKLKICQIKYQELSKLSVEDASSRIAFWQSAKSECEGTGLYEYILGKIYIASGQYDIASKAFSKGLKFENQYTKELLMGFGDIYLTQRLYKEAADKYMPVISKYSDWWPGYSQLGLAQLGLKRYQDAKKNLEKAVSLGGGSSTHRNLGIAAFYTKDYERAYQAIDIAYELNENILADRDAIIIAARSCVELKKYELAQSLLAMLLTKRPDMETDPGFLRAGFYLKEKLKAAGLLQQ